MKKRALIGVLSAGLLLGTVSLGLVGCNNNNSSETVKTGTVVIGSVSHGSVTASKTSGNVGDEITLTVTADDGYELATLTANNVDIKETKKFKLIEGENKVEATFTEKAEEVKTGTVVIGAVTNGSVVASKTSGNVGDEITLTVTADDGYELATLTANGVDIKETKKFVLVEGENKVEATFTAVVIHVSLAIDQTSVSLDEIGKTATIAATVSGTEEVPSWSITDEEAFGIIVSDDGLSCTVENLAGGTAVLTVSVGGEEADCTVKGSIYEGDTRIEYTIYDASGTSYGDYKGLFNAVNHIFNNENLGVGSYVTVKGETEAVYTRGNNYMVNLGKTGYSHEMDGTGGWADGKSALWYSGCPYDSDGAFKNGLIFGEMKYNSEGAEVANYMSTFGRGQNKDASLFLDNYEGDSTAGNRTGGQWSGWRASNYAASITNAQVITWADPYEWGEVDLNWDLSDSQLVPSFNDEQEAIAQIYLGSSYRINKLFGLYFNAGTMTECSALEDGTERDVYTFTEIPNTSLGLHYAFWGEREIGTTSIGKAKWDAFNKCWTFPNLTINLNTKIYYTGEGSDAEANYIRENKVTGYIKEEAAGTVSYTFDYGSQLARSGASERTVYGVSFTPNYDTSVFATRELPDITCGATWTGIRQMTSTAYQMEGASKTTDDNLQIVAGRTANYGNQIGLYGSDSVDMYANSDNETMLDFFYTVE